MKNRVDASDVKQIDDDGCGCRGCTGSRVAGPVSVELIGLEIATVGKILQEADRNREEFSQRCRMSAVGVQSVQSALSKLLLADDIIRARNGVPLRDGTNVDRLPSPTEKPKDAYEPKIETATTNAAEQGAKEKSPANGTSKTLTVEMTVQDAVGLSLALLTAPDSVIKLAAPALEKIRAAL